MFRAGKAVVGLGIAGALGLGALGMMFQGQRVELGVQPDGAVGVAGHQTKTPVGRTG
jgi:hypothetical protein